MKRLITTLALISTCSMPALAGSSIVAGKAAVSTVSPYATQVGVDVMRNGGNAIDATVAIAFALQVAYPQAGNLGGGGFLVYYEAKTGAVWTLDFRECAPQKATPTMFADKNGKTKAALLTSGPLSIAVPGGLAGLEEAHRRFGSLPWKVLVEPAVRLAHEGVRTNSDLTADLAAAQKERQIDRFESTADRFYPGGKPLPPGSRLLQPELAETLERIAEKGPSELYQGQTARRIVRTLAAGGGLLGYHDLDSYRPVWRAPIRIDYGQYQIYTVGPPSGGGLVLAETLAILGGYDLASFGFQTTRAIHVMAEAERRAFLDRNRYVGDPASIHVPFRELVSDDRAKQWRASIDLDRATPTSTLTEPGTTEAAHTTHFSVTDPSGNVVAMTTTLDSDFGSGMSVEGIFLNNAMSEFTIGTGQPAATQLLSPNSIAPGRRMASSMTPTIVLRDNKPFLALGTKGGAMIPTSVLQVFLNVVVYHKSLDEAIAAGRFHHQGLPDEIVYEKSADVTGLLKPLTIMGHAVRQNPEPIGDIQALMFEGGKIHAVADPRHPGAAGGF